MALLFTPFRFIIVATDDYCPIALLADINASSAEFIKLNSAFVIYEETHFTFPLFFFSLHEIYPPLLL
jgi:hypothetical protein